jgi:hypothetical protein
MVRVTKLPPPGSHKPTACATAAACVASRTRGIQPHLKHSWRKLSSLQAPHHRDRTARRRRRRRERRRSRGSRRMTSPARATWGSRRSSHPYLTYSSQLGWCRLCCLFFYQNEHHQQPPECRLSAIAETSRQFSFILRSSRLAPRPLPFATAGGGVRASLCRLGCFSKTHLEIAPLLIFLFHQSIRLVLFGTFGFVRFDET